LILVFALTGTASSQRWPFQDYPAKVFQGTPSRPKLETPLARKHATIIRREAKRGANFAGHYRVIAWGCGTSCAVYVIVDERTGTVFEPLEISKGVDLGVSAPQFRVDSTLMIVANCPSPEIYGLQSCERKFYIWGGSQMRLIKSEPVRPA
jgi:hypothetical protein